ncbi:hypothetical protein HN903_01790 [archaeon]|nr:hypothetical protein [archaeon]MBT7128465.1 hypothetical protein [archaeon]
MKIMIVGPTGTVIPVYLEEGCENCPKRELCLFQSLAEEAMELMEILELMVKEIRGNSLSSSTSKCNTCWIKGKCLMESQVREADRSTIH